MRSALLLSLALAACGSTSAVDGGLDGGPDDAGVSLTDGGPLGAACSGLDQCAGNPICGGSLACPRAVICAAGACASAGGPPLPITAEVGFASTVARLPTYLQVDLLAPQRVGGGTLDCATALSEIDGGPFPLTDEREVNPLVAEASVAIHASSTSDIVSVPLEEVASGAGRVLVVHAYLTSGQLDGGDTLVAAGCSSFDALGDGGASTGLTLR